MNYKKIYFQLVSRSVERSGYVERHHILPKCLGGTDAKENLVDLYPEEHYLAHLLLCKIYPENQKLLYASMNMATGSLSNLGKRNNKKYGWVRRQYAKSISGDGNPSRRDPELQKRASLKRVGQKRTVETREKMSAAQRGRKFTREHKENLSIAASKRLPISEETRSKLRKRKPNKGMLGKKMSKETKAKMSAARRGKKMSEETKAKMRAASKLREEIKRQQRELTNV